MENYEMLRTLVDKHAKDMVQENYEGFIGIADDAEDDSHIDECIGTYLDALSKTQNVDIEDIDLSNEDSNDLLYLVMGE